MFEGLFGDEDDAFSQSFAMGDALTEVNGKRFPAPSAPRRPCGLCGIQNQGSTCYLNSLLQTLLYTPEFRESLFQIGSDELGELSEKDNPQAKVRVIPIQLQRLFAQLLLLDQYTVSTTDLTDSFGWTNNEELQQHDVQELNRILFSAIDNSLVGTSGQHLISKLYHGSIVNQIICQQCGKISERQEDFLDLTLAVCGYKGLEDVLYSCYQEMELLSGSNQYRCEKCNKLVNAKKGARLRTLPPILTLSLLRFSYDFVKCERYKETGKFTFPLEVDMSPYCENTLPAESTEYELFSVVIHKGSGYGGHYHAFIRDVDTLGKWNSPEDEPIHIASDPSSGKIDYIELGKPDEVLSAILVQEGGPHCNLTIDKLCQNLIKHTGVTWNKRFKKHYGPIQKFLKKHDETFNFSPTTNSVSLKHTDKKSISLATVTMETSCEKKLQENEQLAAEETFDESRRDSKKSSKYKREPSPPPLDGHAWYDFNDSRVFPIKDKDIQKQYSGKESAYMLFYRRKSLKRPNEAKGQRMYGIPSRIQDEITAENIALAANRDKYDTLVNMIEVKLLHSNYCTVIDDVLQLRTNVDTCVTALSIDRRKTIAELETAITEVFGSMTPSPDMCLHTVKDLPAGLHLYNHVSGERLVSMHEAGISNETLLFVWNGIQVDGVPLHIGASCEPLLLTITYTTTNNTRPQELTRTFRKDSIIGEIKVILSDIIGIDIENLVLSLQHTVPVVLRRNDDGKTLSELSIEDGDRITATSSSKYGDSLMLTQAEAERQSKMISFIVENRCSEKNEESWPVIHVEVVKDYSVQDLKGSILSKLGLVPDGGGRLRIDDENHGIKPPLHEKQDLSTAGLTQGMRLVLEAGTPPKTNQITLVFTPGDPASAKPDMEIVVDKNCTIKKCLTLMLEKSWLEGSAWHLRKTNWCGEEADVLDYTDATLEEENVKNGHHLLLVEGKLPPRGFLRLPIYLYSTPSQSLSSDTGIVSSITSSVENLLSNFSIKDKPLLIGEVELSREDTLEDLKYQVLTLQHMSDLFLPTIQFLRLRVIEEGKPARILRNLQQTLKRHKLTNSCKLCAQITPQEEDLSTNTIVLNICRRIPDTRSYTPCEEMILDTSKGATPLILKQTIADRLCLQMENLQIAKHWTEQYEWMILDESSLNANVFKNKQGKGKRKNMPKVNLRQGPFYLKDGDTVGVKDIQHDSSNKDDFTTVEDDIGKEKLKKQAEERKLRRIENRLKNDAAGVDDESGSKSKDRKPEVGIHIHVGDFR